jgi:hypothetical protein
MATSMTIHFQMQELEADDRLRQQVEADLQEINRVMPVASARVTLQQQCDVSPPCQAMVTLSVAGPDLCAAARDYNWPAAWCKAVARLREQIAERQTVRRPEGERTKPD